MGRERDIRKGQNVGKGQDVEGEYDVERGQYVGREKDVGKEKDVERVAVSDRWLYKCKLLICLGPLPHAQ